MLLGARDYARATRAFEVALEQPSPDADGVIEGFLAAAGDLLALTSSCWHLTDPVSGLPLSGSLLGDPPGSVDEALQYEYRRPDVNRFGDLRISRTPVSAISIATGERPGTSARFTEMIEPTGTADELRVSFSDAFGTWAALVVFTGRRMTAEDLRFVAGVVPSGTAALRMATAVQSAQTSAPGPKDDSGAPSVLIIDAGDRIVSADATARRRLALLPDHRDTEAPGLVSFLGAQARWDTTGAPATARMRTIDGRWFVVDASVLDEDRSGSVAVVMRPAPAAIVLDSVLRALGLSAREREVAGLIARGHSTKAIAAALVISPWTVQDHVRAIYAKTGVGSRSDLAALATGGAEVGGRQDQQAGGRDPSALTRA